MSFVSVLLPGLIAGIVTLLAVLALRPLAVTLDLIDRPGGRKTHHGEVPVVGGLAMFIGIVVGLGLLPVSGLPAGALGASLGLLVLTGMLDDRFDLPHWVRLPIHAAVALLLLETADCRIETLGDAFGTGTIHLAGAWVYVATIVLVAAAVNAFNMMDGMDGLAGMVASVALVALSIVAWQQGAAPELGVCVVLVGSIFGFLVFNAPLPGERRLRCFMGDAGSTLLGVALAWVMVRLTQMPREPGAAGISPVTALWIAGLPVFELFWSFTRRLIERRSPFVGDADHFHHMLIRAGFGVRGSFVMFLVLTVALATIGLELESAGVSESWSLLLLVGCGVLVVFSIYHVHVLVRLLPPIAKRVARTAEEARGK